jgi:hypothetical protein
MKARGLLAGVALLAGTAGAASATSWLGNGSYCGGSGFNTCFSVDLSWTYINPSGSNFGGLSVVLQLKNDDTFNCSPADCSAGPLKWFAVGIDLLPADIVSDFTSGPEGYQDPPPNDLSGGPFTPTVAEAANPGGSYPGITFRTWTFTFTGDARTSAQWDAVMNAAGVGYHAGGTACPSTKIEVHRGATGAYAANQPAEETPCDVPSPPTEIIPEPMTMSLMALGLVGIGGVRLIRRRRKV